MVTRLHQSESIHDDVLQILSKLGFPFTQTANADNSRPFTILTFAQLLDGSISYADSSPMAISCKESKLMTHTLRSVCGGILIGSGTLEHDNPRLSARNALFCTRPTDYASSKFSHPIPVVMDKNLQLTPEARLIEESMLETLPKAVVFHRADASSTVVSSRVKELEHVGVVPIQTETSSSDPFGLECALKTLYDKFAMNTLMIEGGASVILNCLNLYAHLIDLVIVTVRPAFATSLKRGASLRDLTPDIPAKSPFAELDILETRQYGTDLVVYARIL